MPQHRLTAEELKQVADESFRELRKNILPGATNNDPIFVITVVTGSTEWSSDDLTAGDVVTALSGAVGERIQCRYRFESPVDADSFSAHNLRWDRLEGDVKYADITKRNKSAAVVNAIANVTGTAQAMLS